MRTHHLAVVVLLLASLAHAEIHAVLIGIDKYDSEDVTALRYTVSDVTAFRDLLVDPQIGGAKPENIVLLTPQSEGTLRPTRTGIMVQIKRAALRTLPGDTLIFYFAGHGMQTDQGQFLLGVDADPLLLADTAVPVDRLPAILSEIRAKQILVVIDACRNDPSAGRAQADNKMTEAFARGLRPQILGPDGGGPKKIATWLACAVGERAWELSDKQHGVFSHYLLEGLKGGAAQNGQVSLQSLAAYVQQQVATWARQNGKTQSPKLDNTDGVTLVLARPRPTGPQPGGGSPAAPKEAILKIESEPTGATVLVGGSALGQTPYTYKAPSRDGQAIKVTVQVQLDGHKPAVKTFEMEPGEKYNWSADLPKIEGPAQTANLPTLQTRPKSPDGKPGADGGKPGADGGKPTDLTPHVPGGATVTIQSDDDWPEEWEPGPDGQPVVTIESGSFTMGLAKGAFEESPQHEVSLDTYQIQAHEVSNQAYSFFLNQLNELGLVGVDGEGNVVTKTSKENPEWKGDWTLLWTQMPTCGIEYHGKAGQFEVKPGMEQLPVTPVTYVGAAIYAGWFGMALPTEAQWERAALGKDDTWRYPWGPNPNPKLCNLQNEQGGLQPVVSNLGGRSVVGCLNMVGNVWEWTSDAFVPDYHRRKTGSYEPRVELDTTIGLTDPTLRGGGFTSLDDIHNRSRRSGNPFLMEPDIGFRCVVKHGEGHETTTTSDAGTGGASTPTPTAPVGQAGQGAFTFQPHPVTGAQLAVPKGYVCVFMPPMQVALITPEGDDDPDRVMVYFPVGPNLTDFVQIQNTMLVELRNMGFTPQSTTQDGMVDVGSPAFQVHRRVLGGEWDGDWSGVMVDVIRFNNKFHALVFGAKQAAWEKASNDYLVFMRNTNFP